MRHVLEVRDDRARGRHARRVLVVGDLLDLEAVALLRVSHAEVGPLDHVGDGEEGVVHLERLEDALAHELLPGLARLELDQVPGRGVHHVVVEEDGPWRFLRLHELQLGKELPPRVRRLVPDQIVAGDARAVREHVAQGYGGVQEVVVELDRRHRLAHRLIPRQLPFLDQQARGHGREKLRVRGNLVEGFRREGELLAVVAVAVPLREDQLVPDDDGDADRGDIPVLQRLTHPGVEALELCRGIAVRRLGREASRECEDEASDEESARRVARVHGSSPSRSRSLGCLILHHPVIVRSATPLSP